MNPAIPGTPADRTGSGSIQRRALAEIDRRFKGLTTAVLAVFDGIPVYALNDDAARVAYGMTPEGMAATAQALQEALDRWIEAGRDARHVLWYEPFPADAAQMGAAQAVSNLSNLSPAYAAARSLETVIYSAPYRTRMDFAQIKSYDHWSGASAEMKSELSQIIGRAVVDGKNPVAVRTEIAERLGVSRSKAAQYAQTDVTDTLRQARWAEADHASESMGLRIGILWTSALKPTTRAWHASRNGKVYTVEEVKAFYSVNGNRFRCFCGNTEALLDTDNNPILTDRLKASMLAERTAWEKEHGAG